MHSYYIWVVYSFKRHYLPLDSFPLHAVIQLSFLVNLNGKLFHACFVVADVNNSVCALAYGLANLVVLKRARASRALRLLWSMVCRLARVLCTRPFYAQTYNIAWMLSSCSSIRLVRIRRVPLSELRMVVLIMVESEGSSRGTGGRGWCLWSISILDRSVSWRALIKLASRDIDSASLYAVWIICGLKSLVSGISSARGSLSRSDHFNSAFVFLTSVEHVVQLFCVIYIWIGRSYWHWNYWFCFLVAFLPQVDNLVLRAQHLRSCWGTSGSA